MGRIYSDPQVVKFVKDMEKAGIETRHYRGRWYWSGPAAFTNEKDWPSLQDVMGATKVKLQRDNLAFDWVCYPVASDEGIDDGVKEEEEEEECTTT
jgi:hypothetical protein